MTLNDIIQSAQGGAGLQNLASQFGLSPEQTQSGGAGDHPGAVARLAARRAKSRRARRRDLARWRAARTPAPTPIPRRPAPRRTPAPGALGQIFGSPERHRADRRSRFRASPAIDPQIIASLLPAVASIALGGLSHAHADAGPRRRARPGPAPRGRRRRAVRLARLGGRGRARRRVRAATRNRASPR